MYIMRIYVILLLVNLISFNVYAIFPQITILYYYNISNFDITLFDIGLF